MKSYAEHRATGRRVQHSARAATQAPSPAADRPLYQLTPQASKNNAFCWLSWEPQVHWRGNKDEVEAQSKRARGIEQQRAAGVDPLHIAGMRSKTVLDPARFALPGMTRTPWAKGLPGARK